MKWLNEQRLRLRRLWLLRYQPDVEVATDRNLRWYFRKTKNDGGKIRVYHAISLVRYIDSRHGNTWQFIFFRWNIKFNYNLSDKLKHKDKKHERN